MLGRALALAAPRLAHMLLSAGQCSGQMHFAGAQERPKLKNERAAGLGGAGAGRPSTSASLFRSASCMVASWQAWEYLQHGPA